MRTHRPTSILLALALLLLATPAALAQLLDDGPPPMNLDISLAALPAGPNGPFRSPAVAVVTIAPHAGWYTYAHDPGSVGTPTVLTATLEGAAEPLLAAYPPGARKPDPTSPGDMINMYAGPTPLFAALPADALKRLRLSASVEALLCTDKSCRPAVAQARLERDGLSLESLPKAEAQPWWPAYLASAAAAQEAAGAPKRPPLPASEAVSIEPGQPVPVVDWKLSPRYHQQNMEVGGAAKALLLALLAGFILNFMPCVLPVVSLKLSGLLAGAAMDDVLQRQRAFVRHNLAFSAGVMCYFAVLSVVMASLGMAWGQIFQEPRLIMALAALVLALALSLFGVYQLPVIDLRHAPTQAHGGKGRNPAASAFFTGLLATLLATPCSGPFLGGVLAWTLLQPPHVVAGVFLALGLGMASPYLLMAVRPSLVRFFPRPGGWSGTLEVLVAFILLATCIYLLQILPPERQAAALTLMWLTALCAWAWGHFGGLNESPMRRRAVAMAVIAALLAGGAHLTSPPAREAHWEVFLPARLASRMGQEPMLVDFTADWCVSCKFLEKSVLRPANLARWQKEYGLRYIRVDLTQENPHGMRLLRALGSTSIPTVALFPAGPAGDRPLVLRDLFTSATLEQALKEALRPEGR